MPYTGYDPQDHGGPVDASGGGIDQSMYYLLSPGGRFNGDMYYFLEFLAAASRGDLGANPDYDVSDLVESMPGWLGRLARFHERNVQQGGEGSVPEPYGGYPYHFFSGPGAQYGPVGGPLHGLGDQGNDTFLDGDDYPNTDPGPLPPRGGGGGGGRTPMPSSLPAYGGLNHQGSFLSWQPSANPQGPATFVSGGGQSFNPPRQPAPQAPSAGGGRGGRGRGGSGNGGGRGSGGRGGTQAGPQGRRPTGTPPPTGAGGRPAGQPAPPTGRPGSPEDFMRWLMEQFGGGGRVAGGVAPRIGGSSRFGYSGVDTGMLDRGTPGYRTDPTTSVQDTSGFPLATPRPQMSGETDSDYLDYLHDRGFREDDLAGFVGPHADWGTGGVVRGPNGYTFRNTGDAFFGSSSGSGSSGRGGTSSVWNIFRY